MKLMDPQPFGDATPKQAPQWLHDSLPATFSNENIRSVSVFPADLQAGSVDAKFDRLKRQWLRETALSSRLRDIHMAKPYLQIIGLGPAAIPLLVTELRLRPNWWFWALEAITGENPTRDESRGDLFALTEEWLKWATEKGY